jgi:hypothetical protein
MQLSAPPGEEQPDEFNRWGFDMKIISIAALAAVALTPLAAQAATPLEKETAIWQAFKDKKAEAFKGMLERGYVAVYADGTKSRDQELQSLKTTTLDSFKISDFAHSAIDSENVLMTYTVEVKGKQGKTDISGKYRAASVWHHSGKGAGSLWRGTFHTEVTAK